VYGLTGSWNHGFEVGGSFLLGALFSGLSGIVSMVVATKANLKTAAISKNGLNAALQMSLRGGTVSAIVITALSLLGISGLYLFYRIGLGMSPEGIPALIVGYGFGASFVALFAQLGGGIYTKAADVGADLVGKIEAGIPEDDPRNPAVIADLRDSQADRAIGPDQLKSCMQGEIAHQIVLLATGWGDRRARSEEWWYHSPRLSPDGAQWLVDQRVKGVGIEHYSVGGADEKENERTHTILLSNNVWIVEELRFPREAFSLPQPVEFWSLPINLKDHSGAFCRPVLVVR